MMYDKQEPTHPLRGGPCFDQPDLIAGLSRWRSVFSSHRGAGRRSFQGVELTNTIR